MSCEMLDWMSPKGWNQDCWEKYQQPPICEWYHSNGRKWRGTKEPLMGVKEESEKAGLKLNTKKVISWHLVPSLTWQIEGEKVEAVTDFLFLGSKVTVDGDCSHEIRRRLFLGRKAVTNLDSVLKAKTSLCWQVCIVKAMLFPVVMYTCKSWADSKEDRVLKTNAFKLWCCTRLLRVPWAPRRSKPVNLNRNQLHTLFRRTDAEAPIHWPPNVNSWLIGKDPDAGKDWRQKKKRLTEDEMVGWHHQFKGHELGQILGDGKGQGSLARCSLWRQ